MGEETREGNKLMSAHWLLEFEHKLLLIGVGCKSKFVIIGL